MSEIFGMKIFWNPMCLETTKVPERRYKRKRWQTEAQVYRRQKKWIKRWGYKQVPCMFKTPLGLMAHPSLRPQIEAAISGVSR